MTLNCKVMICDTGNTKPYNTSKTGKMKAAAVNTETPEQITGNIEQLIFSPALPENYKGKIIQGAESFTHESKNQTIIIQEVKTNRFTFRHFFIKAKHKMKLFWESEPHTLYIQAAIKSGIKYNVDSGQIELKEGQYNILYTPAKKTEYAIEPHREYEMIHSAYPEEWLDEVAPGFLYQENADSLQKRLHWMHPEFINTMFNILYPVYEEGIKGLAFERLTYHLLYMTLAGKMNSINLPQGLSVAETRAAYKVFHIISADVTEHHTIQWLAKKVSLDESRLKRAFKRIFGIGIYARQLSRKMDIAKRILLETDRPIKDIYDKAGYTDMRAFITAFRKYFGEAPATMRRRHLNNSK